VLLSLIAKHKLEVTELALSQVTEEFCSYIREQDANWDLAEATSFLVVAATLLDLKAARLLPSGEVDDEEDLALLEARDLLFARLLQYRAFKEMAAIFGRRITENTGRIPRTIGLDPEFATLLPEVIISISPDRLAELAAAALAPSVPATVSIDHIHAPAISVAEQTVLVAARLEREGSATFRGLISDVTEIAVIVARFLSLLELFRQGRIALDQAGPLGDLHIRWTGQPEIPALDDVASEFDEEDLSSKETPTDG
jgi:segregation and condensation protein A